MKFVAGHFNFIVNAEEWATICEVAEEAAENVISVNE